MIFRRAFILAAALACAAPLAAQAPMMPRMDELMRPGVSLELARHRAATLRNVRYLLELDVTAQDSAPGRVSVTVERAAGAGDLVLDFRGPSLGIVTANGETVADGEWKHGHLRIPARWLRDGDFKKDPVNARFYLWAQKRMYSAIDNKEHDFHLLEWVLRE